MKADSSGIKPPLNKTDLAGCVNLECLSLEGNFSNFLDDRYLQSGLLARNALSRLRIFDVREAIQ